MVLRDRNHSSIIFWGTRVNESHNDVELCEKTNALARSLDGSRSVSGSMTTLSTKDWIQDVFAYDDYHHARPDGSVDMAPPVNGVPFMYAEAVGQFQYEHGIKGFHQYYQRAGNRGIFEEQALFHAHAMTAGSVTRAETASLLGARSTTQFYPGSYYRGTATAIEHYIAPSLPMIVAVNGFHDREQLNRILLQRIDHLL